MLSEFNYCPERVGEKWKHTSNRWRKTFLFKFLKVVFFSLLLSSKFSELISTFTTVKYCLVKLKIEDFSSQDIFSIQVWWSKVPVLRDWSRLVNLKQARVTKPVPISNSSNKKKQPTNQEITHTLHRRSSYCWVLRSSCTMHITKGYSLGNINRWLSGWEGWLQCEGLSSNL